MLTAATNYKINLKLSGRPLHQRCPQGCPAYDGHQGALAGAPERQIVTLSVGNNDSFCGTSNVCDNDKR